MRTNDLKLNKAIVQEKIKKNNLTFSKSFYGQLKQAQMKNRNFITPDREINPPEDNSTVDCIECNGSGQIIEYDEDDQPEHFRCIVCEGTGQVINENENDEW